MGMASMRRGKAAWLEPSCARMGRFCAACSGRYRLRSLRAWLEVTLVLGRGYADEAPEHASEMRQVVEADRVRDLRDRGVGFGQEVARLGDAVLQQEAPERQSMLTMEGAAELRLGQVAEPGHDLDPDRLSGVLADARDGCRGMARRGQRLAQMPGRGEQVGRKRVDLPSVRRRGFGCMRQGFDQAGEGPGGDRLHPVIPDP